jgi:hypothetical protein
VDQIKWAWDEYLVYSDNIDVTSNPTFVIMKNTNPDPEGPSTYPSSGYAVFRLELSGGETWERFRWVSDYYSKDGNDITTMVSYRQANTIGGGSFSTSVAGADTDVTGIILPNSTATFTEIRVDFATTDEEISPVLFALEVIKRAPSAITTVSVVDDASALEVQGLEANAATFFDVLTAALEPYDWEFSVLDGTLSIAATFGTNRTNDFSVVAG